MSCSVYKDEGRRKKVNLSFQVMLCMMDPVFLEMNTCLPMENDEEVPFFALFVFAFALLIKLS